MNADGDFLQRLARSNLFAAPHTGSQSARRREWLRAVCALGRRLLDALNCLANGAGLPDDRQPWIARQELNKFLTRLRCVFNNEYIHRSRLP